MAGARRSGDVRKPPHPGRDRAPRHHAPRLPRRPRTDQAGRRLHARPEGAGWDGRDDQHFAGCAHQAERQECKLRPASKGHHGDDDSRRRQACRPGLRDRQVSAKPVANGSQGGTVLLVEDEHSIGSMTRGYLERSGWRVVWVRTGEEALAELGRHQVRIVILDIRLPGIDGFDVARLVRTRSDVPILMLTARDEEPDRVAGLELGADDYLTKPFSPRELVARMKAVLRRTDGRSAEDVLTLADIELNRNAREVAVDGQPVELTTKEFDLLATLLENPGIVVSRDQLLDRVWGMTYPGGTRTVDVHVAQLRRKLGRPELIRTVRGAGYKTVRP
ncbi:MAG: response regulator transcription factor [Actinobacteria bacterium]|nr:MAG: response regulator transcription factor [Actinomycetota bacterium]